MNWGGQRLFQSTGIRRAWQRTAKRDTQLRKLKERWGVVLKSCSFGAMDHHWDLVAADVALGGSGSGRFLLPSVAMRTTGDRSNRLLLWGRVDAFYAYTLLSVRLINEGLTQWRNNCRHSACWQSRTSFHAICFVQWRWWASVPRCYDVN